MWNETFSSIAQKLSEKKQNEQEALIAAVAKRKADELLASEQITKVIKPAIKEIQQAAKVNGFDCDLNNLSTSGAVPLASLRVSKGPRSCNLEIFHPGGSHFKVTTNPPILENPLVEIVKLDKEEIGRIVQRLLAESFKL